MFSFKYFAQTSYTSTLYHKGSQNSCQWSFLSQPTLQYTKINLGLHAASIYNPITNFKIPTKYKAANTNITQ